MRALGLRKMHQTVDRPDNPQMRGMVFKVKHLVRSRRSTARPRQKGRPHEAPRSHAPAGSIASAGGSAAATARPGTTAGKGTKGQKARAGGGVPPLLRGRPAPLVKKLPYRRGFTNIHRVEYQAST